MQRRQQQRGRGTQLHGDNRGERRDKFDDQRDRAIEQLCVLAVPP
jgi:hypothetical protein